MTIKDLEYCFRDAIKSKTMYIGIKIRTKGVPTPAICFDEYFSFESRLAYYKKAFREDLVMVGNDDIQIVGCDYSNSPEVIVKNLEDLN